MSTTTTKINKEVEEETELEVQSYYLAQTMIDTKISEFARLFRLIQILGIRNGIKYMPLSKRLRNRPDFALDWAAVAESNAEDCDNPIEADALLAWGVAMRNLDWDLA